MTLDRRITGGLAWAGLLVVVGVPSADALTSYLSNRDASVLPAVVAPASQAAPVAAKPVAEVEPAATKPAVVQQVAVAKPQAAPTADPVDRFVASGKNLPSYISDGGGAGVTETEVASTPPVQQPAVKPAQPAQQQTDDIAVASIAPQQEQPVVREPELVAPIPMPASMRPHPRAVARTVPPAEMPPQVVANDGGGDFIGADELRDWESGPLSEFLAKRRQRDAGGGDYIQYDAGDAPVYW
jgi:hypothetical protein